MAEILLSVSPSVFSWSMLGRGSYSEAFLLPRPEKGVVWPIPRWTHPVRVAVVAGASAPFSAHPSIECCCTGPQIEILICTRRTTTHQLLWQQQLACGAVGGSSMECGNGRTTPQDSAPSSPNPAPTFLKWPFQETGSGVTASIRYGLLCGLWVWRRRKNVYHPSTSPGTTWPDSSGRWDNRMAAQHLPHNLAQQSSG